MSNLLEHFICSSEAVVEKGPGVRFMYGTEPGKSAFVIRSQGTAFAYENRCAHIPIELDWEHGQFFDLFGLHIICSTHGAYYSPQSGRCLGGPCRNGKLAPLPIVEHDGAIFWIDKT